MAFTADSALDLGMALAGMHIAVVITSFITWGPMAEFAASQLGLHRKCPVISVSNLDTSQCRHSHQ